MLAAWGGMAVEPAVLSLLPLYATAQVSGTMDPPAAGNKLLSNYEFRQSLAGGIWVKRVAGSLRSPQVPVAA